MYGDTLARLRATLDEIEQAGLTKHERRLTSPQAAHIRVAAGATVGQLADESLRARGDVGVALPERQTRGG